MVTRSAAFASRGGPQCLPIAERGNSDESDETSGDRGIVGFAELMALAVVPPCTACALHRDLANLGAISVKEVGLDDWMSFPAWKALRPLEQRRMSKHIGDI